MVRANEKSNSNDIAGILIPPPLIFLICVTSSILLTYLQPIQIFEISIFIKIVIITLLLIISALITINAQWILYINNTPVNPNKPTQNIVTKGIFSKTRNPLYLALMIVTLANFIAFCSFWTLLSIPVLYLALRIMVINKEERYLTRRFKRDYLEYKQNVRRWV